MFKRRSVYFKAISGVFPRTGKNVNMVFICDVMELTGFVTLSLTYTVAAADCKILIRIISINGIPALINDL